MVIEAKQVSLIRNSNYILKEINWSVSSGQHWAILGLNGSGKTSLLNMVNGYIFPSKGEMQVLNSTFGESDLRKLRKSIGWVSTALQERLYVKESAEEIVISGKFALIGLYDEPKQEDKDLAKDLLQRLNCSHLAKRSYASLSQGEKQKVLIARALMSSPRLLILDEPCTGLDIFAKEQLLSIIENLSQEKNAPTLIYVTHRTEEILPIFSHTLLLRRGEVHSSGKTSAVLTNDNLSDFFEAPVLLEKLKDRTWLRLASQSY
ncbi:ABC transporter ATP-binding protein [Clostridium formicaceticum]|uniref:ABC transporter ATP-binding protein YlmA n=1 Tax=Clostridium formicaceticum TaxID=1497 RepID=A0AAC9RJU7_9CLOT|nr:ABC transporter ATP-binding protein [Clostridium formicaceticum]AOY76587.1 molybdenum ABC transporter ATP-binding protein [Clostridium formicaceticum]ARE87007.1 putative ABC transporter ATP-binding protein YlmA [Clostridium formicaceticum]